MAGKKAAAKKKRTVKKAGSITTEPEVSIVEHVEKEYTIVSASIKYSEEIVENKYANNKEIKSFWRTYENKYVEKHTKLFTKEEKQDLSKKLLTDISETILEHIEEVNKD